MTRESGAQLAQPQTGPRAVAILTFDGAQAERVAMSPRNFARVFRRESGCTPGKYVERVRVDAARRLLEDGNEPLEAVATLNGENVT